MFIKVMRSEELARLGGALAFSLSEMLSKGGFKYWDDIIWLLSGMDFLVTLSRIYCSGHQGDHKEASLKAMAVFREEMMKIMSTVTFLNHFIDKKILFHLFCSYVTLNSP